MKTAVIIVLVLAITTLGGVWWFQGWQRGKGLARPAHDLRALPRSAEAIAPGIFILGGLSPSAAYVLETSDGLILVDTGLASDASQLREEMSTLGLDWRNVRVVLLTHIHGDHTGGAEWLRKNAGARIHAGAGDADALRAGDSMETLFSTFSMPNEQPHSTTVDVRLNGGETITVGDVKVQAINCSGHTPGSICYLAEIHGLRAFFAGDVIMMLKGDEPPRSELGKPLGTYSAYLPPIYRGDARESLETLRRLRAINVPDLVLPGHPRAQTTPVNPRLAQSQWEALLDAGIRDMETLLARYEADGADFLDGHPKRLLPELYYLGDRDGLAVYGIHVGDRLILVDSPGGPGFADFLAERFQKLGLGMVKPTTVLLTACGPRETSGLRELIERFQVEVVAPGAAISLLKEHGLEETIVIPAENFASRVGIPFTWIDVKGRGIHPAAYRLILSDKIVLISGRIPVKLSQEAGEQLIRDLTQPPGNTRDYADSITDLHHDGRPNLWLPAVPTQGQNANLYDQEWNWVYAENLQLVNFLLSRPSRQP